MKIKFTALFATLLLLSLGVVAQKIPNSEGRIPNGAKVFIASMPNGFDAYLKAAIEKKKVPVEIVGEKSKAEYQITGVSETQKAGAAKMILMGDWRSTEDASVQVANLASGQVVYAYSVHEQSSNHGRQSAAEACAKHMKERVGP